MRPPDTGIPDGFTITGGAKRQGGDMHNPGSKAVVRDCSFRGNRAEWGGGAIADAGSSNARISNGRGDVLPGLSPENTSRRSFADDTMTVLRAHFIRRDGTA